MNQIFSALEAGYSPERILKYIQKIDPDLALKVNTAMQGGHSIEQILSFISRNGKKISNAFQPSQRGNIYQEARKSVHPALKNAGAFAIGALAGGAGAYALSRAAPQAAQALQGELLPALPKPPPGPFQPRAQLPAPGQAAIQPAPPVEPEGPLPYTNPSAQNRPIPSQGQPPINVQPQQIPEPTAQTTTPSAPVPQQAVAPLPEALQKQASSLLKAGNDIEKVSTALQSLQPKIVKEYEKETGQPIARAVEEFAKTNNISKQQPDIAGRMAPQEEKSPVQMEPSARESSIETQKPKTGLGKQRLIEEGKKKYDEQMNAQEVPEPTAYMPKKERGSIEKDKIRGNEVFQFKGDRNFLIDGRINGDELIIDGMNFLKKPAGKIGEKNEPYIEHKDLPEELKGKGFATKSLENFIEEAEKEGFTKFKIPVASLHGYDLWKRLEKKGLLNIEKGYEGFTAQIKKEKSREISKGSTVALPSGEIGEISDIRQGIATVNAQGKEYRRKIEELIESPIDQKDLADLFKELISGIESKSGEEVSKMVNWAGYDPKTNELAFIPHIGALYVYDNITPEDAKELTNILSVRKTTGENFIGAWKANSKSPIGAAMSRLIKKLQEERGGKGSEYKGKYEKIYDAFELPKIEAKAKHKEKENDKKRKAKKPRPS